MFFTVCKDSKKNKDISQIEAKTKTKKGHVQQDAADIDSLLKLVLFKFLEAIAQEIMPKHFRYLHQLGQIDALSLKHLVYIRLLAINLSGKPNHGPALTP